MDFLKTLSVIIIECVWRHLMWSEDNSVGLALYFHLCMFWDYLRLLG